MTSPPQPERHLKIAFIWLAACAILLSAFLLSMHSLLQENPTIDEVIHLPAGLTYWQSGSFRMYPHNPPLVKLIAALPVLAANPVTQALYSSPYWLEEPPNKAGLGHLFAQINARRYFELFTSARLLMPAWSALGGLVVFCWSRRIYGPTAGLLSLFLWSFCPNVLAHGRLITTDIPAAAIGIAATYAFRRSLDRPAWPKALGVGALLGIAQLTKYSLLVLCLVWPVIWLVFHALAAPRSLDSKRIRALALNTLLTLASCILIINLGYRFEGTGRTLGSFPFTCAALTRPRPAPLLHQPRPSNPFDRIREYRANRFQNTPLAAFPVPLPRYYVQGFDDQKLEAEGIPTRFLVPPDAGDRMGAEGDRIIGYPVYLNGRLRSQSWSEYYLFCLLYKLPEGTLLLLAASFLVLLLNRRSRAAWAEELCLLSVPATVLLAMSFGTNINLGLRYVLPAFPYLFVAAGKLLPWIGSSSLPRLRGLGAAAIGAALLSNLLAIVLIHPHYLAYFNRVAGGPDHGSEHLIDSNIDWGQDLVGLERWARRNLPSNEPLGIAYFGQINPAIFTLRGQPLNWYLPPVRPGALREIPASHLPGAPGARLRPGWYAVSASLLRGLEWRVYDPGRWAPYAAGRDAFSYFQSLKPAGSIGHSILLFHLRPDEVETLQKRLSLNPP